MQTFTESQHKGAHFKHPPKAGKYLPKPKRKKKRVQQAQKYNFIIDYEH